MQIPPKLISRFLALGGMSDDIIGSDIAARPEVNKKQTVLGSKSCFSFNETSNARPGYIRDMCDVLVTSRPPFYLQIQQEIHFLPNSLIAARITRFSVRVNDTFVKDETILFDAWNHFDAFLFQIILKIIRRYHIGGTAMIRWVLQFSQNIFFHGLKIQDSWAANSHGESSDLTHHFTLLCRVPIVFGAPRNELGDDVTI